MKQSLLAAALFFASAASGFAQTVGSLPDKSPFLDTHDEQRIGLVAGWLATGNDIVGVGPKSAPIGGIRYDLAIGGPVYLTGILFGTNTTRTVLDYSKSASTRNVGTQSTGLVYANVSLAVAVTGQRTWHKLQPLVNIGVGVVSGAGDNVDISGYHLGTQFSFSYGLGVRYVTGHSSEFRIDLNQYWWQLKYPSLYRSTQGDPVAIKPGGSLNSYTANTAITLGWSIRAFR